MDESEIEKFDERVQSFQAVGSVRFFPEAPEAMVKLKFAKVGGAARVALISVTYRIGVEHPLWLFEDEPLVCLWEEQRFRSRRDIDDEGRDAQIVLHADRLTLVQVRRVPHVRVVGEWLWPSHGKKRARRWAFEGLLKAQPSKRAELDDKADEAVKRMLRDWHELAE